MSDLDRKEQSCLPDILEFTILATGSIPVQLSFIIEI